MTAKEDGKMIANTPKGRNRIRPFNSRKYGKLLAEIAPTVIRTESEKLLKKGESIVFGSSGRTSEAINSVRLISKVQWGGTLAEFFHVSADLFI